MVILCGALYFLEKFKTALPGKPVLKARSEERQKIPPRTAEYPVVLEDYSSAAPGALSAKKRLKTGHGSIAIIVDDMGGSTHEARMLLDINLPITFSIIPELAHAREVAEAAHRKGEEVMVHVPMEPKGVEKKPFEKNGLLLEMSDEEIVRRMLGYIEAVPYAAGANNHMGSSFTENREKMRTVLNVLKERKMFFIDSKTTPASTGDRLAREMGVRAGARNVFLDNQQDVAAVRAQIGKLAAMAKRNGGAIGICHPHKTTIQALAVFLPALTSEGITFVHASELVR